MRDLDYNVRYCADCCRDDNVIIDARPQTMVIWARIE